MHKYYTLCKVAVTNSNNYVNLCYAMFRYIEQMFNKLEQIFYTTNITNAYNVVHYLVNIKGK